MSSYINVGDRVCVPVERIAPGHSCPFPIVEGTVISRDKRTVTIDLPYGIGSRSIASSAVLHTDLSISIIRIGDFQTEISLLDPLTKTLTHFLKLLLPDDRRRTHYIRTPQELYDLYERENRSVSIFVIVGHASDKSLHFGMDSKVTSKELADTFYSISGYPHDYLFLCCESGKAAFAKDFSASRCCNDFVGPMRSLHGASAAQFGITLLSKILFEGTSFRVSFKQSARSNPGTANFRNWRNGHIYANDPYPKW